jgi:hypothetical protein
LIENQSDPRGLECPAHGRQVVALRRLLTSLKRGDRAHRNLSLSR